MKLPPYTQADMGSLTSEQIALHAQYLLDNPPTATRAELIEMLRGDKPRFIEFKKVSGEIAGMLCTLNPAFLPPLTEDKAESVGSPRAVNESIIHVYSIDRQAWRSFRVANIISLSDPLDL